MSTNGQSNIDILIEQVGRMTEGITEVRLLVERVAQTTERVAQTTERVAQTTEQVLQTIERVAQTTEQQAIVAAQQAESITRLITMLEGEQRKPTA
jgi:methyl-accepting chemotaxis protein